ECAAAAVRAAGTAAEVATPATCTAARTSPGAIAGTAAAIACTALANAAIRRALQPAAVVQRRTLLAPAELVAPLRRALLLLAVLLPRSVIAIGHVAATIRIVLPVSIRDVGFVEVVVLVDVDVDVAVAPVAAAPERAGGSDARAPHESAHE